MNPDLPDAWRHDELGWYQAPDTEVVEPRDTHALGVDVSSWQGQPDWRQVAASGRSFVYIKAGEGTGTTYPSLDGQYAGARAAGLLVGLYWYADPGQSPEANADAFAAQVNRLGAVPGHLPPCLDLETGSGNLAGWAQRFVTRLRQETNAVRVMVYSSASFFAGQIGEGWMDPNIALWIAHFGAPPGQPSYLTPRVAIHQYTNTGQVAGVAGNVDLDYAIWSLTTIAPPAAGTNPAPTQPTATGAVPVLAPQEEAMLTAAYQQLSGSATVGQWPGWPSWAGGSGRSLTLVDYARQADVQLCQIKADLDTLRSSAAAASLGGALSDLDVQRIATAVVALLADRLAS